HHFDDQKGEYTGIVLDSIVKHLYEAVWKKNGECVTHGVEFNIEGVNQSDEDKQSALAQQTGGNHYKTLAIQPVEYIHKNGLGFIEGSVIKYVTRWRSKNGIEDLRKARHFIDLLIELEGEE